MGIYYCGNVVEPLSITDPKERIITILGSLENPEGRIFYGKDGLAIIDQEGSQVFKVFWESTLMRNLVVNQKVTNELLDSVSSQGINLGQTLGRQNFEAISPDSLTKDYTDHWVNYLLAVNDILGITNALGIADEVKIVIPKPLVHTEETHGFIMPLINGESIMTGALPYVDKITNKLVGRPFKLDMGGKNVIKDEQGIYHLIDVELIDSSSENTY